MTAFRGIETDPIRNFKFKVLYPATNGGQARAGFSRVSGLKDQTEVVEYREGTDPATPRKLPGQTTYDNVVCERGLTRDQELRNWRDLFKTTNRGRDLSAEGNVTGAGGGGLGDLLRREVQIVLGDYHAEVEDGGGFWTWEMLAAWPISLEIGEFAGDGNDVVVETVEFAHEGLRNI